MYSAETSVLTIDIGTSSLKAGIVTASGRLTSFTREPLRSYRPSQPLPRHEVDPQLGTSPAPLRTSPEAIVPLSDQSYAWSHAFTTALTRLKGLRSVSAICISGNGPTIVPIDQAGTPVSRTICWSDGHGLVLPDGCRSLYLPRIAARLKEEPDLLSRTSLLVPCPEYLTGKLTDNWYTFLPESAFMPYIWDHHQAAVLGIRPDQLPPFLPTGYVAGEVTPHASRIYGLPQGIPVIAGMTDFHAALLGCGIVSEGVGCDRAGTSEGINILTRRTYSRIPGIRFLPFIVPGLHTAAVLLPSTGAIFTWFLNTSGILDQFEPGTSLDRVIRQLSAVPLHPTIRFEATAGWKLERATPAGHFSDGLGPDQEPLMRGRVLLEYFGSIVGEAVSLLIKDGFSCESLIHCGGQSQSPEWNRMKSEIAGVPMRPARVPDAELIGAAAAAFVGIGVYPTLIAASQALAPPSQS